MTKNYLEKMPFDYYDFFNKNYVEGMIRTRKAKMCNDAGFYEAGMILELLVQENLIHMKAIAKIPEPRKKKK